MHKTTNKNKAIYLDYNSTTPVDPRVVDEMIYFFTSAFGNASSIDHLYGDEAEKAVEIASQQIANLVGASKKEEVIFTSGATESINLVIQGIAKNTYKKIKIVTTPVEHKAVLETCYALEKLKKIEVYNLKVDSLGKLDLEEIENVCKQEVNLLCVMAANNEVGNIYPIEQIGKIAKEYNVNFLCDAAQAAGKIPIKMYDWGITYLTISAHKIYGPKGVGALIKPSKQKLEPILFGGGHQKGVRSGTLNVPGIVGLGKACHLRFTEMEKDEQEIAFRRNRLQSLLLDKIPGLIINGDQNSRLSGSLHLSIPDIPNTAIIARVREYLAISTGAACSSNIEEPSQVLLALKLPTKVVEGALRISIGKFTSSEDIESAATILSSAVNQIRSINT